MKCSLCGIETVQDVCPFCGTAYEAPKPDPDPDIIAIRAALNIGRALVVSAAAIECLSEAYEALGRLSCRLKT